MTPEEFQKIKQAEKEHLRKLRKLKDTVRQLDRQKKVSAAISDMTSSMEEKLDVHDEMVRRLAVDAALNEARLEIALEQSDVADEKAQLARDEADLARAQAKQVVGRIRDQTDQPEKPEKPAPSAVVEGGSSSVATGRTRPASSSRAQTSDDRDDLPEKTIGRMKP